VTENVDVMRASTIHQVWITRYGPPEVLELREAAMPQPSGGEVLIKVAAAGINFADIMARLGLYPDAPKPPCVVGYEVAGEVAAVGASSAGFAVGDRVIALTRFGGYSSYVSVRQEQVFALPPGLDFAHGAALPVTYLTAYQLVIAMGRLREGETMLVHSAAGGVGLSAIALATIIGAKVIGVASPAKHDFLRQRGVQGLIDSRAADLVDRVKQLTGGRGVDLVLDARGGRSWRDSYDCLAPTGRLAVFGLATAVGGGRWIGAARTLLGVPWLRFNPLRLMNDNRGVFGVNVGHLWDQHDMIRNWMSQVLAWQMEGKITPQVDRSFAFAEAAAAHRHIEGRGNIGKVVLVP
jgi:NADPH:quinone reductase-like Zn-dependent oxidoreductase